MSRDVVGDASAVVAMLLSDGEDGQWAAETLLGRRLVAPALAPFECANIMRRQERAGLVSADVAAQAHHDLLDLEMEQWPYELVAGRVWELRNNLTSYDASYVALAERVGAPLVTLDRRLAKAPQLRCEVVTP